MREIKFRAWHKQEQKMYEVLGLRLGVQHGMGRSDCVNYVELQDKSELYIEGEDVELLEYTGLKDKNGRNGYADDLVKMFDRSLYHIVWDDHNARFRLKFVKGDEYDKANVYGMIMLRYGEIVGNICEHPELFKGE